MRHDSSPKDADSYIQHAWVHHYFLSWNQPTKHRKDSRMRGDHLIDEAGEYNKDERSHYAFYHPESFVLKEKDDKHIQRCNAYSPHQRYMKQQVQGQRRTNNL